MNAKIGSQILRNNGSNCVNVHTCGATGVTADDGYGAPLSDPSDSSYGAPVEATKPDQTYGSPTSSQGAGSAYASPPIKSNQDAYSVPSAEPIGQSGKKYAKQVI